MLEKITDVIFGPFRLIRSKIWQVQQLPNQVKGEINRARSEAGALKGEFAQMSSSAKNAKQQAQGAAQKAGSVQVPKPPVKKKRMGLFGSKVACESCGQKLHPSWDECPYCGWKKGTPAGAAAAGAGGGAGGGAAAPSAGGAQRTMALDMGAAPTGSATMLGWFIPLEGPRVGELIELRGRMTVGKSSDNHIVIEDPSVSGKHAEFVGSPTGFKLNDLGSTNGTFVNDKRVQTHDLVDNDNVTLGRVRFKYKSLS